MTDQSRPATGYPAPPQNGYPPPPQSNYYYPNYNAPQPYYPPQPRATFFRRFFAALIAVFIIFGVILLIVWLVLRPRIPAFTVDSATLSSLNTSTSPSQISGTWSLHFSVANPNHKLHVYYDEIEARLFYKNSLVSQNQLPPFEQGTKNVTTMDAQLVASSAYLELDLVNKLRDDRSRGSVKFDVQVLALVRFKAGGWRARRRFLRVFCDDLAVAFSSNSTKGNLSGGPRRCSVGI
ncbi:NDR1/HIN1-like protein 10 [Chenopodium quinoa]|uniref:Late embryogenesis abundant protein LEA-2 subgroup domain-containing protein n=1 Tax=Chenopodium quinoa TaxID=63459 RepID=A0A803MLI0_CHEQI|nr:NDR1/HIN1-like protein 10 [Chenopodium quinoa]